MYISPYIHSRPLQGHNCRHNLTRLCKTAFCKYVSRFNERLENYERRWRTSVSYVTWYTKFTHIPGRKIPDGFKKRTIIDIYRYWIVNLHINNILHMIVFLLLYTTFSILFSTFENDWVKSCTKIDRVLINNNLIIDHIQAIFNYATSPIISDINSNSRYFLINLKVHFFMI